VDVLDQEVLMVFGQKLKSTLYYPTLQKQDGFKKIHGKIFAKYI